VEVFVVKCCEKRGCTAFSAYRVLAWMCVFLASFIAFILLNWMKSYLSMIFNEGFFIGILT